MWKERDIIVKQPIVQSLFSLALPAVGSSLFFVIYEIVDLFWIGRLGQRPVAALSAASFFVLMLRALALTVAVGVIATVSRRVGQQDVVRLRETAVHGMMSAVIFSGCMLLIFFPFTFRLFQWIRLDSDVAIMAGRYARIFMTGLPFVFTMLTAEHIIRGVGNTKIPMLITGFSLILNGVLDPLFIFQFNMGLAGAALATILAQVVGCVLMTAAVFHFLPGCQRSSITLRQSFWRNAFFPMIKIGAPISLNTAAFSLIYLVLAAIITVFGNAPLAAIGIALRLFPILSHWVSPWLLPPW